MRPFLAGIVLAVLIAGCGDSSLTKPGQKPVTAEEVKEKITDAAKTTGQFALQKKDEYQRLMEKDLAKLDEQIKTLRGKLAEMSGEAKTRAEQQIRKLETQRGEFSKKLDELKSSGADAWQHVKEGVDSSWEKLKSAYDDVASEVSR